MYDYFASDLIRPCLEIKYLKTLVLEYYNFEMPRYIHNFLP
jgi:hypothetical protein